MKLSKFFKGSALLIAGACIVAVAGIIALNIVTFGAFTIVGLALAGIVGISLMVAGSIDINLANKKKVGSYVSFIDKIRAKNKKDEKENTQPEKENTYSKKSATPPYESPLLRPAKKGIFKSLSRSKSDSHQPDVLQSAPTSPQFKK